MSRDWRLYVKDILQCCEKICRFTAGMTTEQFLVDDRTYDAVLRNLEIIGEAAKRLPPDVRARIPQLEWKKIITIVPTQHSRAYRTFACLN